MVPRIFPITIALISVVLLCSGVGCTRSKYRPAADKRSYELIASRLRDPRWMLPSRALNPRNASAHGLPSNLDCAPKTARRCSSSRWMYCPDGHANKKYWSKIPDAKLDRIPAWLEHIPRNEAGMFLSPKSSPFQLALLIRATTNAVRKCLLERFGVTETSSNSKPSGWRTRPGLSRYGE